MWAPLVGARAASLVQRSTDLQDRIAAGGEEEDRVAPVGDVLAIHREGARELGRVASVGRAGGLASGRQGVGVRTHLAGAATAALAAIEGCIADPRAAARAQGASWNR